MHGSPALLINGVDRFARPDERPSLSCRLYRDEAGRTGRAPSVAALRQVLAGALVTEDAARQVISAVTSRDLRAVAPTAARRVRVQPRIVGLRPQEWLGLGPRASADPVRVAARRQPREQVARPRPCPCARQPCCLHADRRHLRADRFVLSRCGVAGVFIALQGRLDTTTADGPPSKRRNAPAAADGPSRACTGRARPGRSRAARPGRSRRRARSPGGRTRSRPRWSSPRRR